MNIYYLEERNVLENIKVKRKETKRVKPLKIKGTRLNISEGNCRKRNK